MAQSYEEREGTILLSSLMFPLLSPVWRRQSSGQGIFSPFVTPPSLSRSPWLNLSLLGSSLHLSSFSLSPQRITEVPTI